MISLISPNCLILGGRGCYTSRWNLYVCISVSVNGATIFGFFVAPTVLICCFSCPLTFVWMVRESQRLGVTNMYQLCCLLVALRVDVNFTHSYDPDTNTWVPWLCFKWVMEWMIYSVDLGSDLLLWVQLVPETLRLEEEFPCFFRGKIQNLMGYLSL